MNKLLLALTLGLCTLTTSMTAQDGSLDTSFGTNGKVVTDIYGLGDEAHDIVVQSDGKILVAGFCRVSVGNSDFCVVRYNTDGSIDTGFGINGVASVNIVAFSSNNNSSDEAQRVFIQNDGKIVLTGLSTNRSNSDDYYAAARFNSDGVLDTTYGTNGTVIFDFGGRDSGRPADATMLDNNKVIISGYTGSPRDFASGQLDATGNLDQNFSIDGKQTTDVGGTFDEAYAVTNDASGNIYVAGEGDNDFSIIKYSPSGRLDTTFNSNGIVSTNIATGEIGIRSLAILPDGKIMAVGVIFSSTTDRDIILIKYNDDGSLDTSFGTNGYSRFDIDAGSEDIARSLTLQNDGKIVVSGSLFTAGDSYFFTTRFNTDGTIDNSFSGNGVRIETFGPGFNIAYTVKMQPDGKLLVAGYVGNSSGNSSDFAIARYNNTDTLSINDKNAALEISLHPNPTSDLLNIESRVLINRISITDSSGRIVFVKEVANNEVLQAIPVQQLISGLYFATISAPGATQVIKFIKK